MRTWKHSFSAGAALLAIAPCSGYAPPPPRKIHTSDFGTLKPGVTTKAEVRQQVGIPLTELAFPQRSEEVWEYRYLDGTTIVMLAYLHFDQNGVFKYAEHQLDPVYNGGGQM